MRANKSILSILAATLTTAVFAGQFKVLQKIPLEGDSRWDAMNVDSSARRLYIAHGMKVNVLDIDTMKPVGTISNTPGVRGVAVISESGRGYLTQNRTDSVTVFDAKTLKKIGEIPTQKSPEAIVFDTSSKRVFAFNERSNSATVIDPDKEEIVATIPLTGRPASTVADGGGRVYVNIEDQNRIAEINARTLKVDKTIPLSNCEGPSGLALDAAHRRLFVACANSVMIVVDADSGKNVAALPIGERVETAAFDERSALIFNSSGDGAVTVIKQDGPDKYHVQESVSTQTGTRTLAIDPKTRRVFVAAAQYGETPAATPDNPKPRAPILPDTFHVIVIGE